MNSKGGQNYLWCSSDFNSDVSYVFLEKCLICCLLTVTMLEVSLRMMTLVSGLQNCLWKHGIKHFSISKVLRLSFSVNVLPSLRQAFSPRWSECFPFGLRSPAFLSNHFNLLSHLKWILFIFLFNSLTHTSAWPCVCLWRRKPSWVSTLWIVGDGRTAIWNQ